MTLNPEEDPMTATTQLSTKSLTERACDAVTAREEANVAYNIERAAQQAKQQREYALHTWEKKLAITVDPANVTVSDSLVARTEYQGVKLAHRYTADYRDQLYVELPCPRRDEAGDGEALEHSDMMVEFYDLASLGDALTTVPPGDCFKCQERREQEIENAPVKMSTHRPTPLERLGNAIQDVIDDAIRRSIEP